MGVEHMDPQKLKETMGIIADVSQHSRVRRRRLIHHYVQHLDALNIMEPQLRKRYLEVVADVDHCNSVEARVLRLKAGVK